MVEPEDPPPLQPLVQPPVEARANDGAGPTSSVACLLMKAVTVAWSMADEMVWLSLHY